jgi:hypothetical protein
VHERGLVRQRAARPLLFMLLLFMLLLFVLLPLLLLVIGVV